jgi:hypothetical protein
MRRDGFSGDVALILKEAPGGASLSGAVIPAGQDQVRFTLTVPPTVQPAESFPVRLEGRATIDGRVVERPAAPVDDMMQAFAYHHLAPADDLQLTVARGAMFRTPARMMSDQLAQIPAGGSVRLKVQAQLPPNNALGKLQFELSDPPEGVTLREGPATGTDSEIVLACDAAKCKPGSTGNLIVNILAERQAQAAANAPRPNAQRVALGALPAIPFEVVSR